MRAHNRITTLRVEPPSESLVNEYRIRAAGAVESRLLDLAGRPCSGPLGSWRKLDENELALHDALRTVVWKWMQVRSKRNRA